MNEDRIVDIFIIAAILCVIGLKITGVITLSWLWLLSPIWISLLLGVALAVIMTIIILIKRGTGKL